MIINIRGALGTQIFEYLSGLDRAERAKQPVQAVEINGGGPVVETVKIDWLTQVIKVPYNVTVTGGRSKQDVWKKPALFSDLANNTKLFDRATLTRTVEPNGHKILHVRGTDRQIADQGDYLAMMQNIGRDVKLLGDDRDYIDSLISLAGYGQNISGDVIDDWYLCVGCDQLYSAFTNFTLSAMLYDPNKKFQMLDRDSSHGPVKINPTAYSCIDQLFKNYLKNSIWMQL